MTCHVICHVLIVVCQIGNKCFLWIGSIDSKVVINFLYDDLRRQTEDRKKTRRTDRVPDLNYSF